MSSKYSIYKIIETCHKYGVKSFRDGDLELEFTETLSQIQKIEPLPTFHPSLIKNTDGGAGPLYVDDSFKNADDNEAYEEMLETLMIEDPVAYEELITQDRLSEVLGDKDA